MIKQIGCGFLVLIVVVYFLGSIGEETKPPRTVTKILASSEKLAIIDQNSSIVSRESAMLYAVQFGKLRSKCEGTSIGLADTIVKATQVLFDKKGVKVNNWKMMTMIDDSIPQNLKLDCVEIAAALILLVSRE